MKKVNYMVSLLVLFTLVFFVSCTQQNTNTCTHEYQEIEKLSTCKSGGYSTYKCIFCDETYTKYVTKCGHNYELIKDTATCETDGMKYYKCHTCNEERSEYSLKTNHSYENGRCVKCNKVEVKQYYHTISNFSRSYGFTYLVRVKVGEMSECIINENGELYEAVVVRLYFKEGYYSKYDQEKAYNIDFDEEFLTNAYCEYDNLETGVDISYNGILKLIIDKSKVEFFTKYDEYLISLNLSSYSLIGEYFEEGKQYNVVDWVFVPDELVLPLKDGKVYFNDEVLKEIENILIEPQYDNILSFNDFIEEEYRLFNGDGYEQISKWYNAVMYMLENAPSMDCGGNIAD